MTLSTDNINIDEIVGYLEKLRRTKPAETEDAVKLFLEMSLQKNLIHVSSVIFIAAEAVKSVD